MADRGDTHYSVPSLNRWFLVSSFLLLFSTAWMVIDDWNSPWKQYQAEFRTIEEVRTRGEIASDEMQQQASAAAGVQARLDQATANLASRQDEVSTAGEALLFANGELFSVSEKTKKAKQELAWQRFLVEEHRIHELDPTYGEDHLAAVEQEYVDLAAVTEVKTAAVEMVKATAAALQAEVDALTNEQKAAKSGLALLETKLGKLAPESMAGQLANVLRDVPGIDFVDPKNKVKKQVLDDLSFELNFTKGARIDMCQTCHEASDRSGFTEEILVDGEPIGNPYLTHPRLDLFLTAKSAHPVNKVGCTICHRGAGQALDFIRADHRPVDDAQAEEWQEEHHWHKQHHWDYPMLAADFTEASCVQCHKGSMELIADDAPTVSRGFRLFEEKGCYACHKVDWFPTTRAPGPSLKNLQSKLDRTWVESWIAKPKEFRPDTKMPQLFHLSNLQPEQVIATSEWGSGREMLGQEWNDTTIASISAALYKSAPKVDLPAIPGAAAQNANADRGRETFRVVGCLGCHNLDGYPGEDLATNDMAFDENERNSHGPNLRGVSAKVDRTWLYNWIKNPKEYWPETRMPNLRLSDQEAADITSYIKDDPDGIFGAVPSVWSPARAPYKMDVLQEMARNFFSRIGRDELGRRFAGENDEFRWDNEEVLLLAIGDKQIAHVGCFSCHDINGFEGMNPIGAELSTWGSKTVDKLAWEFRAKIKAHEEGWDLNRREEFKYYRENWIYEKLKNPRIFDDEKVRAPLERLRMPKFGLTDDEILAISNFVVGLVDDEVQVASMHETTVQASMNMGARVVRQQNCMACHVLEPAQISYTSEDGEVLTVRAEPLPLGDANTPPALDGLDEYLAVVATYEASYGEELEDYGFRLLEVVPGVGLPGETVFLTPGQLTAVTPAKGGNFVATVLDYYMNGIPMHDPSAAEPDFVWNLGDNGAVADVDGTLRSYAEEDFNTVRWAFAPPVLIDEGSKLQRDWFYNFLLDPQTLRPQMRVKMPTFNLSSEEAASVADYFAYKSEKAWPGRYARALHAAVQMVPGNGLSGGGKPWPELSNQTAGSNPVSHQALAKDIQVKEATLRNIQDGYQPDIDASFEKLVKYGDGIDFMKSDAVHLGLERITQRSASYHNRSQEGRDVAFEGVNCFTCHFMEGNGPTQMDAPVKWAPDLALTRERLRPNWVRDWLWNPTLVYPGTSMPANFASGEAQYQEQFPDSSNADQINAVIDWLFRLDKDSLGS
ncbi:MAG: cytochrome c1 [Candidatus Paceibacteria bacterium]|jgi:cytochrome c1